MTRTARIELAFWTIGLACAAYLLLYAAQAQVYRYRAANLTAAETPSARTLEFLHFWSCELAGGRHFAVFGSTNSLSCASPGL